MRISILLFLFVVVSENLFSQLNPFYYSQQKVIAVHKAAVVSAHPLASNAGIQILKAGGNAVDAAIATQLALAVVYPGAGNIGGGGFMVARLASGQNIALDFRETAPGNAFKNMYLDSAGNALQLLSKNGHLANAVPGTIAGLFASLKYAKLPFKKLIAPAINLAEKGFAITDAEAVSLNVSKEDFLLYNKFIPAFVKKTPWKAGDILVQKELAQTLRRISKFGAAGFYSGLTAKLIVEDAAKNGGIISYEDLKNYTAKERKPITFSYKSYEIISMPLPSSGGILLRQMLGMVANRNLTALQFQTAESVQLMVEAERRAFADRAEFMGDEDFVKVPIATLMSDKYLQQRMADFLPGKAGSSKAIGAGVIKEHDETTHLSVVDAQGNAVSVTTTLNGRYGSRVVVKGAGFIMNNEMDDFSIKEGEPNMYGAVGNKANAIAANKRMLSSMTPTIVLKNKKLFMVVGTYWGTTIPTSVFQTIINVIDFGMDAEDAVNRPKFHHQWLPDTIMIEDDFNKTTALKLKNMGYNLVNIGKIGRTELILLKDGTIHAVADKRGDDDARGF